ncbi:hypothetical protein SAMN05660860_00243 [Geoalkalibacter ferrihydriticus]|uniref:Uncharacterized protein n=2 Tax=Geoalkalibacter ferrihydriticus TaxID=392333 RepID=A0A0C2HKT2_9BACT|nr:hypothetical protein [Geoalkalibacter ferrihydriticus]KIH75620.1 hypothetical protein GFER_15920 [Geoalkalibacter ferrihydriticus DSM 17813]SDL28763.1 hypothetical protein SAMN05660860_00243 [Geoalkalibacter ferrihydriticus]
MNEGTYHFFSLIMGINLILIGAAALAAAIIGIARKKMAISSTFALLSLTCGPIFVYVGISLLRSAFN